jgi:hypothetical protein
MPVLPTWPPVPSAPWHWAQFAVAGCSSVGGPKTTVPYSTSSSWSVL